MLASSTRRLLIILCAVAAVAVVGVTLQLGLERLAAARAGIVLHEEQVHALQESLPSMADIVRQRDALKAEVDRRTARFYAKGETDPYAFGTLIRRKLASLGITVQRYQLVDVKGASYMEFSATGPARAFVLFLRDVSQAPRLWSLPSLTLTVREATDTVDAVFRIGYVVGDS